MYGTKKINCGWHSMNIFFKNELWVMNFKTHFFLIFIFFNFPSLVEVNPGFPFVGRCRPQESQPFPLECWTPASVSVHWAPASISIFLWCTLSVSLCTLICILSCLMCSVYNVHCTLHIFWRTLSAHVIFYKVDLAACVAPRLIRWNCCFALFLSFISLHTF